MVEEQRRQNASRPQFPYLCCQNYRKNLAALGSPHADLDAAYQADGFAQLRQRIKEIRRDAKDNGNDYRLLMPESEQPLNRLSNWNSWLGQYGRFLSGDDSQADEIRDYVL